MCGSILALKRREGSRTISAALLLGILAPLLLFGVIFRAAVPPYLLPSLIPAAIAAACALGEASRHRALALVLIVVYSISSVTLVAETRRQLLCGAGTSIPATEKLAAIDYIVERSPAKIAIVMQDGRQKTTGLDIAYVVLAHQRSLTLADADIKDPELPIFVIVDHRTLLRRSVANFLRHRQTTDFLHLSIVTIPPAERAAWVEIVDRNPAQLPAR